jgi:hypothetical protein
MISDDFQNRIGWGFVNKAAEEILDPDYIDPDYSGSED